MGAKGDNSAPHTALYRKYRSRSLDELKGQSQVTEILKRSLAQGKVAHAYLLTGPKGVGKTSIARILAHEINQLPYTGEETHLDIIEIDAASNNGVDDVRDLREKVNLAPSSAAKKVYIIDEVHMLSKSAFNALLKTLEEPPAHVVFILATTDLHKVPATIISRTQHFALHSISQADLAAQLKVIADGEGIKISDDALAAIAARGDGSFRNSISLLDQLSSFADDADGITLELVETTLGLAPTETVDELLNMFSDRNVAGIIGKLDELELRGIQPVILTDQLIVAVRQRLADQPQYVHLLDALLAVPSSPQPQLKLLTVLVSAIKPKTAAASAGKSTVVIEAPVEIPAPKAAAPKPAVIPQKPKTEKAAAETPAPEPEPVAEAPKPKKPGKAISPDEFDWAKVVEHANKNFVALYSVISKCQVEFDGSTLTIFAGRKFNKTKLDEAKYLTQLHECLAAAGADGLSIVALAESKPPEDEDLAKIAAIMGGGQEINV